VATRVRLGTPTKHNHSYLLNNSHHTSRFLLQRQEIGEIFNAKSNTESWFCGLLL